MLINKHAHSTLTVAKYQEWYKQSMQNPDLFWGEQAAKFITWFKPWDKVIAGNFKENNVEWFLNGKLNACFNCVDRHLPDKGNQVALIWEGDNPNDSKKMTYKKLHEEICRFANVLKKWNVKKGDRVGIYMPMIPEAVIAMLACARIGAIHSVIFGGFSAEALKNRLDDADCHIVITADEGLRGGKIIPLKRNVDSALKDSHKIKNVIVVQRTQNTIPWNEKRDHWYHEEIKNVDSHCECEEMDALDPLYILYTSGSTGKPKGILHATGGNLVYVAMTHQMIFDYREGEVYWCTADVGWVTGHSYSVYGPLCNGATVLIFEGIPNYPTPARCWEIIDKHQVNIFYTAPTAIRALRKEGDEWVKRTSRKSLRILGTVGEPINPDVWNWYFDTVGNQHCPVVDTWWQTETGGILISPLPYVTPLKPGSAGWPFFGVAPSVLDEKGKAVPSNQMGDLVITQPWPGMMKTVYNDRERFLENYFKKFPGNYLTGDEAKHDEEGFFWIMGRNDDVLKISGHRIGTGELENAFLQSPSVAEAAVVAVPNAIKGESIYAFVTLKDHVIANDDLKKELVQQVRSSIGAIASPDYIQWAEALPKTRSGKIMRRLLRKIANNDVYDLGDISTLTDPTVVEKLIAERVGI